jgi:hypothetical protein
LEGTDPVKMKLAATLAGGAAVMLALSGCGDDANSKANDWAKQVCDKVQPQLKKIGDANASIQKATSDNSKPADVQKTDSVAFENIAAAYKALGSAVSTVGAPPVDGGAKTQQAAVQELNATAGSYAQLKTKVDALDTGDQAKFADGLNDVSTQLGRLGGGDQALRKLQSGDVATAMAKQPGCRKASTAAS